MRAGLEQAAADRTPEQQKAVEAFYRGNVDGPIKQAEAARDAAEKSLDAFRNKLPSAMVMQEGKPRDAFVLIRGEYDKRGGKVAPACQDSSRHSRTGRRRIGCRWPAGSSPATTR